MRVVRRTAPVLLLSVLAMAVLPAAPASAAWTTSTSGNSSAKAGNLLTAPTGVTAGTTLSSCITSGSNSSGNLTVSWSAVPGAKSYAVTTTAPKQGNTTFVNTTTVSAPAITVGAAVTGVTKGADKNTSVDVQVRAIAGNWQTPLSATLTKQVQGC